MVKKPEPSKEQFRLLKEQIYFWEKSLKDAEETVRFCRAARNKNKRILNKLEKRYPQ